jgi:hypothetical protein
LRLIFHKEANCDAFLLEHQGIEKEETDDRDFSILIKDSNAGKVSQNFRYPIPNEFGNSKKAVKKVLKRFRFTLGILQCCG